MLRKIAVIFIVIILTILTMTQGGCVNKNYNNENNVQMENSIEGENQTKFKEHEEANNPFDKSNESIQQLIENQLKYIRNNDLNKYIETLDPLKDEYIAEKESWFRDLIINDIKDFDITIEDLDYLYNDTIIALINQSYNYNGKSYSIKYENKYINNNGGWVDSDLNFKEIETENFVIKYPATEERIANIVAISSQNAYEMIVDRLSKEPIDKTVIKIYNDLELLRQSVKLTFAWQFGGWYEYPESIKIGISEFDKKLSDDQYNKKVERVVSHELTHKITLTRARNNLPYWLAEGLATHYTDYYDWTPNNFRRFSSLWSIDELEARNLEVMTDNNDISKYYRSAGAITTYISYEFGKDKLLEIIEELGHYSYVEGTGVEVDSISIDRFHEVIEKVLGMSIEELDNYWINYKENL
ncbi:MAG: hypothetical protein FH761_10675 [Firmicutes bacterium]|nr:hypothetical protein [Bacillota bacterium]